jgi:hypothetical protein
VLVFELKTQLKTYDLTHGLQFGLRMLRVYITALEFGLLLMLTAMLRLEILSLQVRHYHDFIMQYMTNSQTIKIKLCEHKLDFIMISLCIMKDRRRRPEGGEWELTKIHHRNLAYIPKSTRCPSLLTRPRPYSYSEAIGRQNQARDRSENTERC